jgi:hypothetical protein
MVWDQHQAVDTDNSECLMAIPMLNYIDGALDIAHLIQQQHAFWFDYQIESAALVEMIVEETRWFLAAHPAMHC